MHRIISALALTLALLVTPAIAEAAVPAPPLGSTSEIHPKLMRRYQCGEYLNEKKGVRGWIERVPTFTGYVYRHREGVPSRMLRWRVAALCSK